MSKFLKPCLTCGVLSPAALCPTHQAESRKLIDLRKQLVRNQTQQYKGDYRRRAKAVREAAIICHLCGMGAKPNDPWQADHIIPADPNSPLKAAHRSCNARRGNKPITQ